jgi:hypothetical protein
VANELASEKYMSKSIEKELRKKGVIEWLNPYVQLYKCYKAESF